MYDDAAASCQFTAQICLTQHVEPRLAEACSEASPLFALIASFTSVAGYRGAHPTEGSKRLDRGLALPACCRFESSMDAALIRAQKRLLSRRSTSTTSKSQMNQPIAMWRFSPILSKGPWEIPRNDHYGPFWEGSVSFTATIAVQYCRI